MNELSDDEVNRRLAALCFPQFLLLVTGTGELRHQYADGRTGPAFAYCSSLDACATVEAGLKDEETKRIYVDHLVCLMEPGEFTVMAKAPQRARALLATLTP